MTIRRHELGQPRIHLARTTSTMDEIAARVSWAPEGLTVVADEQTQGRGRANRQWHAPPGSALLFSTLLRPGCPSDLFHVFPLLAGLAVAEAIESCTGVLAEVKWPNDVLIDGRKVAGLLVTSRVAGRIVEHATLGVGINVFDTPDGPAGGAISIETALNWRPDAERLLDETLASLSGVYWRVLAGESGPLLDRWLDRAVCLGELVDIVDGAQTHTGRFTGVTPQGALVLQTESGGVREVHGGDLVRGPVRSALDRR